MPVIANNDPVNHPNHYISAAGIESIDVIQAFTEGLEGYEAYATGNILKYVMRWKSKNGVEDLEKARWYLDSLIDELKVPNQNHGIIGMKWGVGLSEARHLANEDSRK